MKFHEYFNEALGTIALLLAVAILGVILAKLTGLAEAKSPVVASNVWGCQKLPQNLLPSKWKWEE